MINRVRTIFAREFRVNVISKQFLAVTLLVPLMWAGSLAVSLATGTDDAERPLTGRVAVIDGSKLLRFETEGSIIPFADLDAALTALRAGEVDDVVEVPVDWLERGRYRRVTRDRSPLNPPRSLPVGPALVEALLRNAGVADSAVRHRVTRGTSEDLSHLQVDGRIEEFDMREMVRLLFFPVAVAMAIMMAVGTGSGLLVHGLGEEKENRTLEMLLAIATPGEIYAGKFLGLFSCSFCQLVIWGGGGVVSAAIAGVPLGVGPAALAIGIASFIVGYLFYAGLVFAFAALAESQRGIQQAIMVPMLFLSFSFMISFPVMNAPHGILAGILIWVPFTSSLVASVVWPAGASLGAVLGGLAITALIAVWSQFVAVRLFARGLRHRGTRPSMAALARIFMGRDE